MATATHNYAVFLPKIEEVKVVKVIICFCFSVLGSKEFNEKLLGDISFAENMHECCSRSRQSKFFYFWIKRFIKHCHNLKSVFDTVKV